MTSKLLQFSFSDPYITSMNTYFHIHFNTTGIIWLSVSAPGKINHPINTELMGGILIRAVYIPSLALRVISTAIHLFSKHLFCRADCHSVGAFLRLPKTGTDTKHTAALVCSVLNTHACSPPPTHTHAPIQTKSHASTHQIDVSWD